MVACDMERIDQSPFHADPERARAKGETLEIVADGKTIAWLVPEPDGPKAMPWQPGGS